MLDDVAVFNSDDDGRLSQVLSGCAPGTVHQHRYRPASGSPSSDCAIMSGWQRAPETVGAEQDDVADFKRRLRGTRSPVPDVRRGSWTFVALPGWLMACASRDDTGR